MRPEIRSETRWRFPDPDIHTQPNGQEVWAFDMPGQHVAAVELVLPTALASEPRHLEGVASVALSAADEGTLAAPDGRITELLELQGAVLQGVAAIHHSRMGCDAPARRLPEVMELFGQVVRTPAYSEADVSHHVALHIAAYESRAATPAAVTGQAFRTALHGTAAREGRPMAGTPETLSAITPADVMAWHANHWAPGGSTLILAGDLGDTTLDRILSGLAGWEHEVPTVAIAEPAEQPPAVVIHDLPDAVQATVQVGCITPGRRDPAWAALKLAGHAVCGAFASRLNLELRERRGFTYGVQGGFSAHHRDGRFTVGGSFRSEVAGEAIARLLDGLALAEPFTDDEIADARRFLVGIAPLANETAADIARQAAQLAGAGERPGFVNEQFEALRRAGTADATNAYRAHVSPELLTIAVSGRATDLVPALEGIGLRPVVVNPPGPSAPAP